MSGSPICVKKLDQDKSDAEDDSGSPTNVAEISQSFIEHGRTYDDTTDDGPDYPVDILSVNADFPFKSHDEFLGACVDFGAQRTVIGKRQEYAYSALSGMDLPYKSRQNKKQYTFGDATYSQLGAELTDSHYS